MRPTFKDYNQNQAWLFPPSIDELIPKDHPVRIVDRVLEQIDLRELISTYHAEGKPGYHPKMLLKVMVYAYMDNIYSSRKIEKALKENVNFMWLSGRAQVDHNTIARFRSERLVGIFKNVFKQVVLLLAEEGLVTLKRVYTDGTKIESVAGRYTFVWGNAVKTRKEKMQQQLEEMWDYAQSIADEEDKDPEPPDFKAVDPKKIEQTAKKINKILKNKSSQVEPKKKAKGRYIEKNFPENLKKYQEQEQILQERNSFSKTDTDATFMRMKDDHMQNGQLKPGYNAQISTEEQIIINYTLHQDANDLHTLKPHLESHQELYGSLPEELIADAGYGSQENYELLESKGIEGYVKFPTFDREQKLAGRNKGIKVFDRDQLYYNPEKDFYVCPMGQRMDFKGVKRTRTKSGYAQENHYYQAKHCEGCPLRGSCFKGSGNRTVQRNPQLEYYKEKVREKLLSQEGEKLRKKRTADVEPTFAQLKHNRKFTRFTLRTLPKVEIEFGLHALAHNIKKRIA
ncbi:transposase [Chryseobacterium koreense]|nr:IS1182 family transposase [Chryseobacterium koreense]MBB5334833.1 transposase [Chryseobacterium koreense]